MHFCLLTKINSYKGNLAKSTQLRVVALILKIFRPLQFQYRFTNVSSHTAFPTRKYISLTQILLKTEHFLQLVQTSDDHFLSNLFKLSLFASHNRLSFVSQLGAQVYIFIAPEYHKCVPSTNCKMIIVALKHTHSKAYSAQSRFQEAAAGTPIQTSPPNLPYENVKTTTPKQTPLPYYQYNSYQNQNTPPSTSTTTTKQFVYKFSFPPFSTTRSPYNFDNFGRPSTTTTTTTTTTPTPTHSTHFFGGNFFGFQRQTTKNPYDFGNFGKTTENPYNVKYSNDNINNYLKRSYNAASYYSDSSNISRTVVAGRQWLKIHTYVYRGG